MTFRLRSLAGGAVGCHAPIKVKSKSIGRTVTKSIVMMLILSSYANAQGLARLARTMVGSESQYTVKPGDSLISIGARSGIEARTLAAMNGIKPKASLTPRAGA